MVVGILQFQVLIHDSASLKDKRRVLLSIKDRLHREHRVAVAEVANQDALSMGTLGLAFVGSDGRHVASTLDAIMAKLRTGTEYEIGVVLRDVIHGSELFAAERDEQPIDEQALAEELLRYAAEPGPDTNEEKA